MFDGREAADDCDGTYSGAGTQRVDVVAHLWEGKTEENGNDANNNKNPHKRYTHWFVRSVDTAYSRPTY